MSKRKAVGIVKKMIARLRRSYEKSPLQETAKLLDSLYALKVDLEHR